MYKANGQIKALTIALLACSIFPHLFGCRSSSDTAANESGARTEENQQARSQFWDPIPVSSSTTAPDKIHDNYWHSQFERVNKEVAAAEQSQVVFFGDSITLRWSMLGAEGKSIWQERFDKYNPINMGNSGDITPVMLYRVRNGNLDFPKGQAPRVAVLLCGTNNYVVKQSDGGKVTWDLGIETDPAEVADGIRAVAQEFRKKLPSIRVIVIGILPVKNQQKWSKCVETNRILAEYNLPRDEVVFLDLQDRFMDKEGKLKAGLFIDGTHLTTAGYKVLADALYPEIERLIKAGSIQKK
ncbi:MAG: GDSL-type esterase/lipase family protein [Akkermansiaceae bacterium]